MRKIFPLVLLLAVVGCGAGKLKAVPALPAVDLEAPLQAVAVEIRNEVGERTKAINEQLDQVSGQVGQLQTAVDVAAEQAEFRARASAPLPTFAAPASKPTASAGVGLKVDKVLGSLTDQGHQVQQTLNKAEAVARQVQELVALAQEIRAAQTAIAEQQPGTIAQQGPAGILGLVSLILAILLKRNSKQNKGK